MLYIVGVLVVVALAGVAVLGDGGELLQGRLSLRSNYGTSKPVLIDTQQRVKTGRGDTPWAPGSLTPKAPVTPPPLPEVPVTPKAANNSDSVATLTLDAASPSGARTVSASDNVLMVNVAASPDQDVTVRAAVKENDTILDGTGTPCAISTSSAAGKQVDGTSAVCTLDSETAGDSFSWDTTGTDLSAYARVNFWFKWEDVSGSPPQFADFKVATSTAQSFFQQTSTLTQVACGADQSMMVSGEWYNCDVAMPTGTDSTDSFLHIEIDESTELADTDVLYVDALTFYNDKFVAEAFTSNDVDLYTKNVANPGAPFRVSLKEGGTTVAVGYWSSLTNGAAQTTSAKAVFLPTTEISVAKGTTQTFTLNLDSSSFLNEDSGTDDPVIYFLNLVTSASGMLTDLGINGNLLLY